MEENVQTFANMIQNLETVNQGLDNIPYVLQYNKRDLPNAAPVDYLEYLLNNRDTQVPSFSSSAVQGEGVFETLNMITRMLLHKLLTESGRKAA
jgi:signal recognition particle receptor subunit beta